ncbi:MAG: PEFG-CTERM sorting domain-containing protein [Thaumarchaeota archaeon]|nr:PEFG-CTERM sorting domain-containing protein [Nitrososphaerota archaeon]
MEVRIFYGLIVLLIISTGIVFAQEAIINVQTDDNSYDEGDIVTISGNVTTVIGETPITLRLFLEGSNPKDLSLVDIAQITVAQDGSYSHTIIAEGQLWKKSGNYLIIVTYGEGNTTETRFSFTPKSESIETTTIFEVSAGSQGTFDVEYTIKGGTVKNIIVDADIFAIIVQIESTDEGTISLDLPREFIGAEKQDGKDDTFIILIDGIEVAYQESVVHSDSRVITINFEEGDSDIEIIGTYVIPEFGTIVMMILIAGIMTIIIASRNKFQIKI